MFKTLLVRRSIILTSLFSLSLPSFAMPTLDLQMSDPSPQTLRSQPVKGDSLQDKGSLSYLTTLGHMASNAVDTLAKGVVKAYGLYTIAALPVVTALDHNLRANAAGTALMPISELDRLTQENCLRTYVNPRDCDELFGITTGQYTYMAARYSFLPQLSYIEMNATSENTLQTQRKVKHKVNKSQKKAKTKVLMNELDKYKMGVEFELSPTDRIGIREEHNGGHAPIVTSNNGDWDLHPDGYSSKDTHLRTLEIRTIKGYNQEQTIENINQISNILEKISSAYSDHYQQAQTEKNHDFYYQYNLYKTQNFFDLNIATSTREAQIYFMGNHKDDKSLKGIRHLTLQFPLYQIKRVFNHVFAIPYDETTATLYKILHNDLDACLNLRKKYNGYATEIKDPLRIKNWQEPLRAQMRFCDVNIGTLLANMESDSKTAAGFTYFFTYYGGILFNNKDYTNVILGDRLGGHGPKALLRLLSRISFREMYNSLETNDQTIFKKFVQNFCFVSESNNECLTYKFIKYKDYSGLNITHEINMWSWYLSIINQDVGYPHLSEQTPYFNSETVFKYSKGTAQHTDQLSPPPGMPKDYMGGRFTLQNEGLGSIALIEVRCNDSDQDTNLSIPIYTFKEKMMDSTKWFFSLPAD